MSPSPFAAALERIRAARSIIVLGHLRPDGDAYGSSIGLTLSLKEAGKKVRCLNQDGLTDFYRFLPGAELLEASPAAMPEHDLLIAVDTSVENRLGPAYTGWKAKTHLNLDHHVSNTLYGEINIVAPELPASAALLLDLITEGGLPLTPAVASNLFVGLSTDTGSFRYRGTTAATFRAAARLVEAGADAAELARHCYQSVSKGRFELNRMALDSVRFDPGGRLAWLDLNPAMFTASGAGPEDTEGLIECLQEIKTVELAALFDTRPDGSLKVSLRSKGPVNVSELGSRFGGGGHPAAAGINFKSDAEGSRARVLEALRAALTAS
jgi:phosphoesterase RecJ-like protein